MSKPHRGKNIRDLFAHGRGDCPVCKRSRVKILYEQEAEGQKFQICKICRAAVKNGTKSLPVAVTTKVPEVKAEEAAPAAVQQVEPVQKTEGEPVETADTGEAAPAE